MENTEKRTPEEWIAFSRKNVAEHAAKPPPTDLERTQIGAEGWRELGFEVTIDPETHQLHGFKKNKAESKPLKAQPPTGIESGHASSKRQSPRRDGSSPQANFYKLVPDAPVKTQLVAQFRAKPETMIPSSANSEASLEETHKVYQKKRSPERFKEVRRDTDRERREFLKSVGALTPAERRVRLRKVISPWVFEIFDRLGITEILLNHAMSAAVVDEIEEKLKVAEVIIKDETVKSHDKSRRREFNYWRSLKKLRQSKT